MSHSINELQNTLLQMFKVVSDAFDKNNIEYFIAGGTLLGAVRHQGFIPWDDDIDITIPREFYNKLLKEHNSILPSYLKLESCSTNSNFPSNYAKIFDTRTTLISNAKQPYVGGVFIDIFPLDGISNNKFLQKLNQKTIHILSKIYRRVFSAEFKSSNQTKRIIHQYLICPLIRFFISKNRLLNSIDHITQKYEFCNSTYIVNYFGIWREKEIHLKEWYYPRIKLIFQDTYAYGPSNFNMVLSTLYGDNYMQLPPIAKRKSHHTYQFIDLKTPYEQYKKITTKPLL